MPSITTRRWTTGGGGARVIHGLLAVPVGPSDYTMPASLSRCVARLPDGHHDGERRAPAHLALHADRPAVVVDDSVTDAQAQARPLAQRLGREERVEDPLAHGRVDAGAFVDHFDADLGVVGRLGRRADRYRGARGRGV